MRHPVRSLLTRIGLALLETTTLYFVLLAIAALLFVPRWRAWIDNAPLAQALPSLGCILLSLVACGLLRRRYQLPEGPAPAGGRSYAIVALLIGPLTLLLSVDRFADPGVFDTFTPSAVLGSFVTVLGISVMEEFLYRFVLLGRLLRAGVPVALAVALQSLLFLLAHGPAARTSPHTMLWYRQAGLTLATLYWATRSLLPAILLHTVLNIGVAQTSPSAYWMLPRLIDTLNHDWTHAASIAWLTAALGFWLYQAARRRPALRPSPACARPSSRRTARSGRGSGSSPR